MSIQISPVEFGGNAPGKLLTLALVAGGAAAGERMEVNPENCKMQACAYRDVGKGDEISKSEFRRIQARQHPDKHPDGKKNERNSQFINACGDVLFPDRDDVVQCQEAPGVDEGVATAAAAAAAAAVALHRARRAHLSRRERAEEASREAAEKEAAADRELADLEKEIADNTKRLEAAQCNVRLYSTALAVHNKIEPYPVPDWLDLDAGTRPAVKPPPGPAAQSWAFNRNTCANGDCDIIGSAEQVKQRELKKAMEPFWERMNRPRV